MTSDNIDQSARGVTVGAPVVTRDGDRLGTVKELHGPYFKVDAPNRPDFWLQLTWADRDADGNVRLEFTHDELHAYEVQDIDSDIKGDGVNRTDASLLGESGTSTDVTTAP